MKNLIPHFLILILVCACADNSSKNNDSPTPDGSCLDTKCLAPDVDNQAQGIAYFKQFFVKTVEIEEEGKQKIIYNFLAPFEKTIIDEKGFAAKTFQLQIALFENGTFRYTYSEFKKITDGSFKRLACKEVDGRWDLEGPKFVLRNNGIAHLTGIKTKWGIQFKIEKILLSNIPAKKRVNKYYKVHSEPVASEEQILRCTL